MKDRILTNHTLDDLYELRDNLQFDIDDAADDDDGDAWEAAYDEWELVEDEITEREKK